MRIRITDSNRDRIDAALSENGRYKVVLDYDDLIAAIRSAESVLHLAYRQKELVGTRIRLAPGRTPNVNAYTYFRFGVWATIERTTSGWSLIGTEHTFLNRTHDSTVHLPDGNSRLAPWLADSAHGAGNLGGTA